MLNWGSDGHHQGKEDREGRGLQMSSTGSLSPQCLEKFKEVLTIIQSPPRKSKLGLYLEKLRKMKPEFWSTEVQSSYLYSYVTYTFIAFLKLISYFDKIHLIFYSGRILCRNGVYRSNQVPVRQHLPLDSTA